MHFCFLFTFSTTPHVSLTHPSTCCSILSYKPWSKVFHKNTTFIIHIKVFALWGTSTLLCIHQGTHSIHYKCFTFTPFLKSCSFHNSQASLLFVLFTHFNVLFHSFLFDFSKYCLISVRLASRIAKTFILIFILALS